MTRARRRQRNTKFAKSTPRMLRTRSYMKQSTVSNKLVSDILHDRNQHPVQNDTFINNSSQHINEADDDIVFVGEQIDNSLTQNDDTELHCYSTCTLGWIKDRKTIQCSTCMKLFHTECCDAGTDAVIWNCNKCRNVSDNIESLKQQIVEVHDILSTMVLKQTELFNNVTELAFANNQLKLEVKKFKKENHQLRIRQYNRMTVSDSSDSDSSSSSEDELTSDFTPSRARKAKSTDANKTKEGTEPASSSSQVKSLKPKITVLGSSMVRNTGPIISSSITNDAESTVYSLSGLTIDRASNMAQSIFNNHSNRDVAVLQVGTCDVERSSFSQLTSKYDKLIKTVSEAAPSTQIVLTAIPQRLFCGNNSIREKTQQLNNHLRSICSKERLCFIDANPPLHQKNYCDDGCHFSTAGTSFFARYVSNYICHTLNFPLLPLNHSL